MTTNKFTFLSHSERDFCRCQLIGWEATDITHVATQIIVQLNFILKSSCPYTN